MVKIRAPHDMWSHDDTSWNTINIEKWTNLLRRYLWHYRSNFPAFPLRSSWFFIHFPVNATLLFLQQKSSLSWRKSVFQFLREPCTPYDYMLSGAHVVMLMRPHVRRATKFATDPFDRSCFMSERGGGEGLPNLGIANHSDLHNWRAKIWRREACQLDGFPVYP